MYICSVLEIQEQMEFSIHYYNIKADAIFGINEIW